MISGRAVGGKICSLTFLQAETPITAAASTFTFNNVNIGPAFSDRYVIACVCNSVLTAGRTLNQVHIGGNLATIHDNANDSTPATSTAIAAIAGFAIPTGTTATIDAVFSGNMNTCYLRTYVMRRWRSTTPTATKSTTSHSASSLADTINIAARGALLVAIQAISSTGSFTMTGVNLDDTHTTNNLPSATGSIDGLSQETARPYSATVSANLPSLAMAAVVFQ